MEFRSGGANLFGESRLDVHVDVLFFDGEFKGPGGDFLFNLPQPGFDGRKLLLSEKPCLQLCSGMGDRPSDVVRVEPPII